ncbi:MAG: hypothetical protein ORN54_07080 [Cyclobacteriaceae bacterium]|nr:hypothetical protein [Cyclobacteriaceae bacterium]
MKELSMEEMQGLQGGGWWSCVAMVAYGVATVAGTAAICASGPLGLAGVSAIAAGVGATAEAAGGCVE